MNDKDLSKKLILCVGHISHLIFFLRLKKSGFLNNFNVTIILQFNKSFLGREKIFLKTAKSISDDVYVLDSKYCPFYGRNFIKQIYRGLCLKQWLNKRFDKDVVILGHGVSALTTNIIMSHFTNRVLFKQSNQQSLIGFKLDVFNTLLSNTINFSLNLKSMRVKKLPKADHDSRVFLNNLSASIVEIDSMNNENHVLNFAPISSRKNNNSICIIGIPFMNWGLSKKVKSEILEAYNNILKSLPADVSFFYLRHPNETKMELQKIQDSSGVCLIDVTNEYVSSDHFFIENPGINKVFSVGSYAAITAYMADFYTKVFFRDINFDKDTLRVYEDKFQAVGECIHLNFSGKYSYPNIVENLLPLEIILEKIYQQIEN